MLSAWNSAHHSFPSREFSWIQFQILSISPCPFSLWATSSPKRPYTPESTHIDPDVRESPCKECCPLPTSVFSGSSPWDRLPGCRFLLSRCMSHAARRALHRLCRSRLHRSTAPPSARGAGPKQRRWGAPFGRLGSLVVGWVGRTTGGETKNNRG